MSWSTFIANTCPIVDPISYLLDVGRNASSVSNANVQESHQIMLFQSYPFLSTLFLSLAVFAGYVRGMPVIDSLAMTRLAILSQQARMLSVPTKHIQIWLRVWVALLVGIPVAAFALRMTMLGFVASAMLYTAPKTILAMLVAHRKTLLRDQLVSAVQGLANATQAGLTIYQGLIEIAKETPRPLRIELEYIVSDTQHGRSRQEAIEAIQSKLQLESFSLFSIAVRTTLERGGSLSNALKRIASSLCEHQRIERKMDSDTASGSREILVLCLFPWIFLLMSWKMHGTETMVNMLQSIPGQILLVIVAVLVFIGAKWASKILVMEE